MKLQDFSIRLWDEDSNTLHEVTLEALWCRLGIDIDFSKMQCFRSIGVKDKNNKMIFECDMILNDDMVLRDGETVDVCEVVWRDCAWVSQRCSSKTNRNYSRIYNGDNIEIIGNSYDNNELLREQK